MIDKFAVLHDRLKLYDATVVLMEMVNERGYDYLTNDGYSLLEKLLNKVQDGISREMKELGIPSDLF